MWIYNICFYLKTSVSLPCSLSSDNPIEGVLDLTFSLEEEKFGEVISVDLKDNGSNIPVTDDNKKEYIDLVIERKISKRIEEQFKSFQAGFTEIIPQDLINVFDERELELLIGGIAEIDVDDWKKNTDYRGYTEQDEVIQWFWKVQAKKLCDWISLTFNIFSVSLPGILRRRLVFFSLSLEPPVYPSMDSRIFRAVMARASLPLKKPERLHSYQSHILASIGSICLNIKTTNRWFTR